MKAVNLGIASVIAVAIVMGGITVNNVLFPWQPEYDLPENDSLCITHIVIYVPQKITDKEIFRTVMLNEIKELDRRFDVPDRNIMITNMQDNKTKISFEGIWTEEGNGRVLIDNLEGYEFIESVLEQDSISLITECQ
ncbi:hypothetical protein [Nitrosopumilus piranensis]|uniref:Uncharacterized protein n=1 Tax=Nitrosopumilus piranensis TaxID=1582439 RepID=A0A0C5BQY6_9ARCH|nr:hypothetical protein [Nitrosopumilus piranensis]AJM92168.1 hypothetical protein NPIRD3C_0956 [Nitrosopumilus piranensis]